MSEYIIGIDEAGRGPLAGPVTVAAVLLPVEWIDVDLAELGLGDLRDSKKLTAKKRDEWFDLIKGHEIRFALSHISNKYIDAYGMTKSLKTGVKNSLNRLLVGQEILPGSTKVLLDGLLKAPEEFVDQQTIVKGDETESAISLASIVAKESRDELMLRYAKQYPEYGFENHKGYGTKAHFEAIKKTGICPIHRKRFLH